MFNIKFNMKNFEISMLSKKNQIRFISELSKFSSFDR